MKDTINRIDQLGYELIALVGDIILVKRDHPYHPYVIWMANGGEFFHGDYVATMEEAMPIFKRRTKW